MTTTANRPTSLLTRTFDPVARAEELLRAARTGLLIDHRSPWFGSLSLRLGLKHSPKSGGTAATDGTWLYYHAPWVCEQDKPTLEFLWAHETLHCAVLHPYRLRGRDHDLANIAADHVVNLLLKASGFTIPKWALCDERFAGMAFEQVYAILDKERRQQQQQQQQPEPQDGDDQDEDGDGDAGAGDEEQEEQDDDQDEDDQESDEDEGDDDQEGEREEPASGEDKDGEDKDGEDESDSDEQEDGEDDGEESDDDQEPAEADDAGDDGQPTHAPGGIIEPEQQPAGTDDQDGEQDGGSTAGEPNQQSESDWTIAAGQAAMVARKAGDLPGGIDEALQEQKKPEHDAWAILRQFVEQMQPTDYSWMRPNRRFAWQGLYLPGTVKENMPKLGIAMDRSGSQFSPAILARMQAEVTGILHEFRPESIEIVYFDTIIQGSETFTPDDPEVVFHPRGGGGTLFQPIFDHFDASDEPPAAVIVLTDLYGENLYGKGPQEPCYPVLWATDETSVQPAPFGERITLPLASCAGY